MNAHIHNPYEPVTVTIEQQGELLKVTRSDTRPHSAPSPPGGRGQISEFSAKSRKRLLEKMARLDRRQIHQMRYKPRFVTLTYGSAYPDAKTAKGHLRAFLKRLARRWPVGGVWRLEFQERGAPHFHLLLFGLPYVPVGELQAQWNEASEQDNANSLDLEVVRSLNGVMYYVSKYMAKPAGDAPPGTDADGDGPMGLSVCHICPQSPGRFWGAWGAKHIPWASRQVTRAVFAFVSCNRAGVALDHPWSSEEFGFTVFSPEADRLAREHLEALEANSFDNGAARCAHAAAWEFAFELEGGF